MAAPVFLYIRFHENLATECIEKLPELCRFIFSTVVVWGDPNPCNYFAPLGRATQYEGMTKEEGSYEDVRLSSQS